MKECIECGLCRKSCPIFKVTLNDINSPRGKSILKKKNILDPIFFRCELCMACKVECPLEIDIPAQMIEMRTKVNKSVQTKANKEIIENLRKFGNPFGIEE